MAKALVGRQGELGALLRSAREMLAGTSTTAVLAGDAGIGKTFLLGVLRDEAKKLGARVLTGRASEFEALPLGVFVHALDDHLRSAGPATWRALDPATRAELALLLPALRESAGDVPAPASADERLRGYVAIRVLLDLIASEQPLVLILDDLHWADRSSVELFGFLMRRPPQSRTLLVGAYRHLQIDPDLASEVARATTDGLARYIELQPLDAEESARLVGLVDPGVAAKLYRTTGGNPYFLLALASAGATTEPAATALPPTIARAVTGELDRLPASARGLAEAAAVAGDPFDLDLAVGVVQLSYDEGYPAVDLLVARGILQAADQPREFAFRHPLVRQAVYDGLPPGRRLALHERCVSVLTGRGAAAADLAHHVEHAARPGDTTAVALLADAARQAAARAPANAVRWLRTARRLLGRTADAREQLALVRPLPPLLVALGEPEAAHDAMVEALALAGDQSERVELCLGCVRMEQSLGRYDDAHRRLTRTLAELPSQQGEDALSVMIAMALDAFYIRDSAAVSSWTMRAIAEAQRLGRPVLAAAANAGSAMVHALAGATEEANARLDAALALLPALSDDDLVHRLDVLGGIAAAELYLDRYEACVQHAAHGLTIGRAAGVLATAPTLQPCYGTALWMLGRIDESIRHFEDAVESARVARNPQATAWSLFNLAFAQAMAGDIDDALVNSRESLEIAERHDDSVIATWAGAVVAIGELEMGQPETALATLHRVCGGADLPNLPGGWRNHLLDVAVRCQLELGRPDEAQRSADAASAWAEAVNLPVARAMALRGSASCSLARGEYERAADEALRAATEANSVHARLDAARCRTLAGRALALAGHGEQAVAQLRSAAEFLDSCGSVRLRDEAERELGRLGQRPHRRTTRGTGDSGVSALTAREREIADLVVLRHTNQEIAEKLFLSTKTVETHLRNIFRKLGVSSRADVARAVERAP